MKKNLLSAILLFPLFLYSQDDVRVYEGLTFYSRILDREIKFSVCLPVDYFRSDKRYPVVYLLHGLGDDEVSWLEYGRIADVADKMTANHEIRPMIFIMPQGFRNYYVNDYKGTFLYQDMFVKELVPLADSLYRTLPSGEFRATMGYSMGGFGALVLPLKHPDLFKVAVPLSISIRTDEQYKVETADEWDEQWGRLFGGVGKTGGDRITEFYRNNNPFYLVTDKRPEYKNLKIYIDNGDDEQTLCRSNEELHILMNDKSFSHEFRVRDGGHEFTYWREALPAGLSFISDAFDGKAYRGDPVMHDTQGHLPESTLIRAKEYDIILPSDYSTNLRWYPAIYFNGIENDDVRQRIGSMVHRLRKIGELSPLLLVFINKEYAGDISQLISLAEKDYRIRTGYRFRSLIASGAAGRNALSLCMDTLLFTSLALSDASPDTTDVKQSVSSPVVKKGRIWYYIEQPDNGKFYHENGYLHILFREEKIYHEYRVREGNGGEEWFLDGLKEMLTFSMEKIHH